MENPLAKLIEVEERGDGVYIKVTRAVKASMQVESLERALNDALVTNFDLAALRDIFSRARGVFEKIGPIFEYYDEKLDPYIVTTITPLKANVMVNADSIKAGLRVTENAIRYALNKRSVIHGLKKDVIRGIIVANQYNKDLVVAEGIAPEPGIDGKVEFAISMDPDATPKIDETGKVNYRDIKTFVSVKKGQIIARRIPPKPGKSGIAVSGAEIESTPGKDIRLPAGKNTETSSDGMELIAQKDGIVFWQSGVICVGELLSIQGNVDFSVGNIKYSGDVFIRGNVMPGFVIESEGNIEVMGEVESAKIISRKGFVTINKGIIGKNDTEIFGEKGVTLQFAQECTIKTEGTLAVEKHLLHCNSICSVFEALEANTTIIGGTLIAFQHIEAANIGNDNHIKTEIFLVDKNQNKMKDKFKELVDVKEKMTKQLEPISRELRAKTTILKRAGTEITGRHQQELKKWVDSYNELTMKIKYLETKIEEVKKELKSPVNAPGYIRVKNTAYSGVRFDMYNIAQKVVQGNISKKLFKIKNSAILEE